MKRFLAHRPACFGLLLLLLMIMLAAAAGLIQQRLGIDAETLDLMAPAAPASPAHLLGTDEVGRDLLARLLQGSAISLTIGLTTALAAAMIGTLLGIVAGYRGGVLDSLLMRLTDGVIALPLLPLLIVLGAVDPAKLGLSAELLQAPSGSLARTILIIALVGWTTVARLVRAATLSLKVQDFIRAAEALGARPWWIMTRHLLPNVVAPVIVATTLSVGNIILLESALSFLGLGVQPPLPSWGNMLTGALDQLYSAPALAVWPGLMIFLAVLSFNLVGDGLQQMLDPRARR